MLSRACQFAALIAALAASGCSCCVTCSKSVCGPGKSPYAFQKYNCCCETCGPNGGCGGQDGGCGEKVACGDACGASGCTSACSSGCAAGCDGCGCDDGCGGRPCLRFLRRLGSALNCAGCGECYWNEWYNDPPSCAEPCDCCGNWAGPGHASSCCNQKPNCGCGGHTAYIGALGTPPLEVAAGLDKSETVEGPEAPLQ
jgi:hypothetical protein